MKQTQRNDYLEPVQCYLISLLLATRLEADNKYSKNFLFFQECTKFTNGV